MIRLVLWTLATSALLTAASAQITYQEQGDAGDLPETAQATGTDTSTALGAIRGTLEANGVDMYVIYIADPANFSATTVNNETTFDTQLWLFDAQGKGVVFNDEAVGTNLDRSRIDNSTGCLTGRSAGVYYIAISRYNRDAIGCEEGFIWNSSPARAVRCPDGPERGSRVAGWTGTTAIAGNYEITLTGAFTAPAQSDIPPCPPFDGWDETDNGGGDAGDLPATAQLVSAANAQACQTPVSRIRGRLDADDVDMFAICITDPAAFSASTVGTTGWDTQLWLFRCDGRGVVHNDDNPDASTGDQSRIDNRTGCIQQPASTCWRLAATIVTLWGATISPSGVRQVTGALCGVPTALAPANPSRGGRAQPKRRRLATTSSSRARSSSARTAAASRRAAMWISTAASTTLTCWQSFSRSATRGSSCPKMSPATAWWMTLTCCRCCSTSAAGAKPLPTAPLPPSGRGV
jgi:hypothetical protein